MQVDIFDNRAPGSTGNSAERFAYRLTDDFTGWRYVAIPFDLFTRRTDFQPSGAPDDGLGLDQVSGYAVGFPVGAGAQTAYLDDVKLITLEDTSQVIIAAVASGEAASAEPEAFVVDDSITWDSRQWELVWSDEFEGERRDGDRRRRVDVRDRRRGLGQQRARVLHPVTGQCLAGRRRQPGDRRPRGEPRRLSLPLRNLHPHLGALHHPGQGGVHLWPGGSPPVAALRPGHLARLLDAGRELRQAGWPGAGEIDIMENVGFEPRTVHGTIHGPGYSGGSGIGGGTSLDAPLSDGFHVYAIDWDPNVIRWYVDGDAL